MAEIIQFPAPPEAFNAGNGAREALIDVAFTLPQAMSEDKQGDAAAWSDWVLAELWCRGFKVVPLDGSEGE